jgi:hypothetical protein
MMVAMKVDDLVLMTAASMAVLLGKMMVVKMVDMKVA